ncbi:unnamed protein product [Rhizophagus irregularis]|nr:unnamed protein product [Rhizophagus irregularis]
MDDSDSIFSDNSDAETFTDEFFNNIPEDSDEEECSIETIDNSSDDLTLEVGMTFFTWKSAYDYIKRWSLQQGFFIRQGRCVKVENERRKQTIVCNCEGIYNNEAKKNKNKPSKTHRTNCNWHINLSRPIKNNPNKTIYVTTLLNEHFGHNLDPFLTRFEMNKAFTKPMLDDIEWMCIHGHLKPLSIKRMLKAKYNRKIYNQDLYKVIYKHRKNNPQLGNNDVSQLFVYLETLKEKDPRWIIYKDWDHETNTLTRIFWMSPEQLETWHHYSDVILNDNTAKTNRTLIDIFHAVQERLEEEEDNNDYINWKSSLPCNQSSTIASNAFTNIIDELKLFVTPQIQKVHYSEMEMAFNYDARVLDQSYIKNETSQDWSFADGFIENQEIRQITFHQLLSTCNQSSIKNLWETSLLESNNSLEFLDVINDVSSTSISTPYVSFNKQRLYYANVYGLVKQANQIACKTCDESFIDLLKEYINKKNSEALTLEQSDNMENQDELEVDQENTNQNQIGNPIIRRPKGRLPGTARFKGPLENSSHSNEIIGGRTQNKCGLCYNVGHNRATCPSNPNRKKRRQN